MNLDNLSNNRSVRGAATLMARAIQLVHGSFPNSWMLTLHEHMIALNVGRNQLMNLYEEEFAICRFRERTTLPLGVRISTTFKGYRSIPKTTQYLYADYSAYSTLPSNVLDSFLSLVQLAAERVHVTPYRKHHSPEAVSWLSRITGIALQQPAYDSSTSSSIINFHPSTVVSNPTAPPIVEGTINALFPKKSKEQSKGSGAKRRGGAETKETGDAAEEIVHTWLERRLTPQELESLRWVARQNETPGWDIEYKTLEGVRKVYEVKGTTRDTFSSIEISANEWTAAEKEGANYTLVLVASVNSNRPKIAVLVNPYKLMKQGELAAIPSAWKLLRVSEHS